MKVLVTGASGFVGQHLIPTLQDNYLPVILGREKPENYNGEFKEFDLVNSDIHSLNLEGIDVVIHLAARAHIMSDSSRNPLDEYRKLNSEATLRLAKRANECGVKRFIFVSSIKVNGETTLEQAPFKADDKRAPEDYYGQSKSEAEVNLLALAEKTKLDVVILRPTLIYGPGVKANFKSLVNIISNRVPLPTGCLTNNKRSLVSVYNFVDLITTCIKHPRAANQVFLVSDDQDVSTTELIRLIGKSMDKSIWQIPLPVWCFRLAGKIFKKEDIVNRLIGSLQVDITHTKNTLDWFPPLKLEAALKKTSEDFLVNKINS